MTEKLLTKMLSRSVVFTGEGYGGKVGITGYDVAAALAYGTLSNPAYHLARAKYCDDKASEDKLLKYFQKKIQRTIGKNKWHNTKGRAKGLAWLVLHEGVYGIPCKACEGRGFLWKRRATKIKDWGKICHQCNGTGVGQLSAGKESAIAKISKVNWIKTWKSRNEEFIQYATELENKALRHLSHQLYDSATK